MIAHIAHEGYALTGLRAALHVPRRPVSWISISSATRTAQLGWMERLAIWAERQPMHHRLGSYTQLR